MKNSKKTLLIGLCGLALAFFGIMLTKLDVATAQQRGYGNQSNQFNATGIESMMETVYSIDFSGQTKMIVTGGEDGVFHVSQIPVLINGSVSNNSLNESVSNILGGDDVIISHSNNITVIGGTGGIGVGNSNATFFGGNGNFLGYGRNLVPSVLLGGENNIIGQEGHSNVIVGGSSNLIQEGAENVNILGGNEVNIEGSNVVAGGQGIEGNLSNSFVFNDGSDSLNVTGEGVFFLNVGNGVKFGASEPIVTMGAVSSGAVDVGEIDIYDVDCASVRSENIGLMGVDGQCLVGCTSGSAQLGKWTLLDHGGYCMSRCDQNSDKCVQIETQQGAVDYTSFCTEGLVSTGNATLCNSGGLNLYQNVIFETYLIDSQVVCPTDVNNQCIYQCNSNARLTGDTTGRFPGVTMCFKKCSLPWASSQMKEHNETIIAYSKADVACSNGAGFHDTCSPYKKELICVDGTWYDTDNNKFATTINTTHIYGTCTLQDYVCDTSEYNLTRQQIINDKKDFMGVWRYEGVNSSIANLITSFLGGNITPGSRFQYGDIAQSQWRSDVPAQEEQSSQIGVRGNYKLCIDYVPADTPANIAPNNEHQCVENSPLPQQYHYKFVGCNSGYQEDNGVCRQDCHYAGNTIHHMGSITLFTGTNATCPDACHSVNFTCYDGTLYSGLVLGAGNTFLGGIAQSGAVYVETGCALTGEACIGFDITQSAYNAIQTLGSFTPCQKYAPSGIYACTTLDMKYRLDGCNENYYKSGNTCIACPNPNGYQYLSNSGSTSLSQCHLTCSGSEHVATQNGPCVPCGTGTYNPNYPNPTVNAPQVSVCTGCINKPENSHYTTNGYSPTSCEWGCNKDYYRTGTNNNQCALCISGYYSVSGATHESYCRIACTGGKYVATAYSGCEVCGPGTTSSNHLVSAGYTSNCTGVCPAAPVNSHYITGLVDGCDWQCNANYYKVGTNECWPCPEGYTSASGSVGLDKCTITCTGGNHVAESKGKCVPCTIGSATGQHTVSGGNISYCIACTNGSTNGNFSFTSNGSGGANSCTWACNANYYRDGADGNKCVACEPGYSSPAGSTDEYNCTTICTGGNHVYVARQGCVACSGGNGPGYATGQHVVAQGNKSYCINCTKPANSYFTSNGSGGANSCTWACNANYYKNTAKTGCVQCPSGYTGAAGSTSISACRIKCAAGTHVAEANGLCVSCGLGETTTQHYVSGGNVSSCSGCTKPVNSHYTGSNCNWECNANYYKVGTNECRACPEGYTSASGSVGLDKCTITCTGGNHVAESKGKCVPCTIGSATGQHTVSGGNISYCIACTNGSTNGNFSFTSNGSGGANSCTWDCNANYYRDGADGNKCVACEPGYSSPAGSTAEYNCTTICTGGNHVYVARQGCVACSGGNGPGYATGQHVVAQGNKSYCVPCTSKPFNETGYEYTNNGSGGADKCDWQCKAGYYREGNKCTKCNDRYSSAAGSESESACFIECPAGTHVATGGEACVPCVGSVTTTSTQYVHQGDTSSCSGDCSAVTGSTNGNHYYSGENCAWECYAGYYKNGNQCTKCNEGYTSAAGSTSSTQCKITCTGGNHVAVGGQGCVACSGGIGSGYTTNEHIVYQGNISSCSNCTKPNNSFFTSNGSGGIKTCGWKCNKNYYRNAAGTGCTPCPSGYTSVAGAEAENQCTIHCAANTEVLTRYGQCETCTGGTVSPDHYVTAGSFTGCSPCEEGSTNGNFHYTGGVCGWACNANYYKVGNTCQSCPSGYSSKSGSISLLGCTITCTGGNHVAESKGKCVSCSGGYATGQHTVSGSNISHCIACEGSTNGNSYFTSNGSGGADSCSWACTGNYYRNGANGNKCVACEVGYHSPAGSTNEYNCTTICTGGNHVAVSNQGCIACSGGNGTGYATGQHVVVQGQRSYCVPCTSKPFNETGYEYTNNGSGGADKCDWQCKAGYYLNGGSCAKCESGYTSAAGSQSQSACFIECPAGTYVATGGMGCVSCPAGTSVTHIVNQGKTSEQRCGTTGCEGSTNGNSYFSGANCAWECNAGYYKNGNQCTKCNEGYTSAAGSTSSTQCKITCTGGNHVAVGGQGCVACSGGIGSGYTTNEHIVYQGNISSCSNCTKPNNSFFTSNGSGGANSCNWECNAGYYKNGNSCTKCKTGYSSAAGAQSESECRISCSENTYVASPNDASCTACSGGYITGAHVVSQGSTSSCTGCGGGSSNGNFHYTGGVCGWACNANYYKEGNTCQPCPNTGGYQYVSNSGSTSLTQCHLTCPAGTHVAVSNGPCVACADGYATGQHTVSGSNLSYCTGCTNGSTNGNSHYTSPGTTTTNCSWTCNDGFVQNGNQCISSCGTYNPSNFNDLHVYFLTNEGETGHVALMDRNLGATQVYNGTDNVCTYGYYYQWGNNYGFPTQGTINKSTTHVDASGYGPNNYYSSGTFIKGSSDWSTVRNNNLWGDTTNTESARRGPCPSGYHVPTNSEIVNVVESYWKKSVNDTGLYQWELDFLMPLAGWVVYNDGIRTYYGERGAYWTSSNYAGGYTVISSHILQLEGSVMTNMPAFRGNGNSVRCFKNTATPPMTVHPDGGTGALIIVNNGVITKLGTPTKGDKNFEGWYRDSSFTSAQVTVGQTAPSNLYAKWACDEGYIRVGSQCVTPQEAQCGTYNPSDFQNLDMYFVTDEGETGHVALMDRNLGATQVYTGTDNICTYGYYYQWGNNYGFSNIGSVKTSTTRVNASEYGPNNYYSSDTFIKVSSSPYRWDDTDNANLWGGTSSLISDKQGPCPAGYHVPTKDEFVNLINNYWEKTANYTSSNVGAQRSLDSLMPFAGYRTYSSAGVNLQGSNGNYWSSSRYYTNYAYYLNFYSTALYPQYVDSRAYGFSVRCFRNSPTPSMTLHPNGGTGALIIVHDGVITKLGTPSKSGMIFQGWYSNNTFTSAQVQTGQNAPSNLYAKWGCETGYVLSGNKCITPQEAQCGAYDPDDFQDLDMYFVTSTGAQGHYTMMDRNLGATEVYDGTADLCTYGYYYQWGNNYGFPGTGSILSSRSRVDASGYGPNNYYSSDTFINIYSDDWNIWWSSTQNNNLWGGVTNTNEAMRGPCPSGYHVPSRDDFVNIVDNYWKNSQDNRKGGQWGLDSLMPYAGFRDTGVYDWDKSELISVGYAFYWASTHYDTNNSYYLYFNSYNTISAANAGGTPYYPRYYGLPVRCFKDTPNSNLTIHPNGGTGALIIVHNGVITKLGTPKKDGYTFGGWYSNSTFTSSSQVTVGQNAPSHLYAKWDATQCDNGYYKNGTTCVPCEAGYYCPGGNKYSCGVGTYSAAGADSCTNCPAGYTTSGENSTSVMQCYKEFTVTFDSNGATSIGRNSDSCKTYCTTASNCGTSCKVAPNNITRAGGTVLGWSTNPNATIGAYTINDQITLTADTTYYAITKKEITLTFVKGIGVYSVAPTSNTCTMWNTATGCTVTMADAYCSGGYYGPTWNPIVLNGISNNTTTTATCTQCPSGTTTATIGSTSVTQCYKQYTATFNKNGATSVGSESLVGTKYCTSTSNCPNPTVTAPTITRANWDKLGWSTSASATSQTYNVGQQITLTANTTFYAITRQVCNCGYTRYGAYACQSCPVGTYKNGTTYNINTSSCQVCTNAPEYSSYISNGCNNDCDWQCLDGFVKSQDGKRCVCKAGTYFDSEVKKCMSCKNGYTSDEGAKSKEECYIKCECGTYVKDKELKCESCPGGGAVQEHTVYRGHVSQDYGYKCTKCTNSITANAHYTGKNCKPDKCGWECNADYYRDTEKKLCNYCSTSQGYHSPAGSTGHDSCKTTCSAGRYVATPPTETLACVKCPVGYASPQHTISQGTWSALYGYCTQCTNGPSNSQYTSYGTAVNPTNCPWKCNAGYYKSGDSCRACPFGKTSNPGATSSGDCFKRCEFGGIEYNSGATIYKYLHATETCPTTCQQVTFTCHSDGVRYNGNTQGTPSSSCVTQDEDPSYKLTSCPPEANCSSKSIYVSSNTTSCSTSRVTRRRIDSCQTNGMHSNGTYCCYSSSCVPNTINASYSCSSCAIAGYTYEGSGCYNNYNWACFVSGTIVTMADGTKKNIEDVNIGDKLLGQNGANTVLELYKPLLKNQGLISINGGKNFVTPAHPFMTTEGWKSLNPEESMELIDEKVTLLKVGDVLVTENGYEVVKSLVGMSASPSTQLYNFRVDGDNTYYANGYLVHNKQQHPAMCTVVFERGGIPVQPIEDPGVSLR